MSWRAGTALMVAAVVAAGSFAQTNEQLQKQFNELKASVQRLEAENASLKAQAPADAGIETEINRLSERMAAGTNLRSCASAIRMGGEFRYRAAYMDATLQQPLVATPTGKGPDFDDNATGYWGDMRTRMHQEAFPGEDISDRPLPDVTAPFWRWLFDQDHEAIRAQRVVAQQQDAPWHQPA